MGRVGEVGLAALLALPLQAQAATLVTNIGESSDAASSPIGGNWDHAQGFTTASHAAGYTLTTIEVKLVITGGLTSGTTPSATLHKTNAMNAAVATLTGPATTTGGNVTFTAPANTVLDADSTYFILLQGGMNVSVKRTNSNAEGSGGRSNWTVLNSGHYRTASSTGSFLSVDEAKQIRVKGSNITASTDATLSALALKNAADDSAIDLNETFAPATTTYTADVAYTVTSITIEPTTSDSNATVAYLRTLGGPLADADVNKPGFQVDLPETGLAKNTVKVQVTAEDGNTTETYTLLVGRASASTDATLSALALADNNGAAVSLTPSPFVSTTKDYTADVANGVTSITLTPTLNDSNATVEYLNASDAAITDTDATTPALDAPVVVGDNTFKVKVTAEDGNTTDTYTVVVTRAATACDGIWCATLSPQTISSTQTGCSNGTSQRCSTSSILSDDDFTYDSTDYAFTGIKLFSNGRLDLEWDPDLAATVEDLTLIVDGMSFAFANADHKGDGRRYWNNSGLSWSAGTDVSMKLTQGGATNTLATGAPSVMGMAHVGKVLTAGLGTIADSDGLPATFPDDYTFQWVRVNADGVSNPVNVGTDDEYTLVAADVGKKIFVEVRFTDDLFFSEGPLASAAYPSSGTVLAAAGCAPDEIWCATLTVKALDGGNHFGCANAQSGKACSNSSTLTEDEFRHASTDYAVASVQVRSNGQLRLWVNPDLATGSESLVLHVGSQTFAFQAADTEGANYRYWNNSGLSWSAGEAVALKLTEAVAAEVILPAPRLPSVDDPNAIWMATLTVANLGSSKSGYDASQGGGLTDTAFTYLGDDTPLSGGTYQEVGTLYTIDELSYHTGTGQLLFSLDGQFVGGSAANIFVDVGGTRRSFSQASYNSSFHTYTFVIPNPSWSAGDEVTVKIVVLEEANGPENLAATSAESGDGFDVTLDWDAPTSGGTVTGYRVEHQPDPALQWRTLAASQSGTSYTDSGLGRGTVRYYRVAALRSGGASYSDIVRVQAPPETQEVPGQVDHVDVEPSNTALEVAWNRARTPNSRAPATGYHVQYAQHDGAAPAVRAGENWATVTFPRWMERLPWRTWSGVVEAIEFEESTERSPHLKTVVTGLTPGTNYRVRVRGCTEAGCGGWSYPRRWTTSGAALNATEGQPLTATLEDFPVNHDGSSAFTFRIAFSAEVVISRQDMKEHALTVVGGTVTRARRVDRRKDLWELTVEPAGTGAVSVLVPLGRACTETGALCTADGQALSMGLGHSVPGPAPAPQGQQALAPLAAAFVSVPGEHDGQTEFWLELSFDAAVEQGSKQRIRALLGVTGGSETKIRRKDDRLDHWRVRVEPSSHEAVTVTLSPSPPCGATGAVCTEDGRTFTSALATQIQGPPGLTVADAQVQEAANATLAFAVTLSRAPSGTVTVGYATSDGTATAGSDYTAASGTVTFAAGEISKTVSVPVLDDAHDEGSETLTLTLSNASGAHIEDGTATGTINNTDPMPQAWLARLGRTVGSQVVDALTQRLEGASGSHVTVGGIPLTGAPGAVPEAPSDDPFGLPDWATRAQREESARSLTANDLLLGSAFHLSSGVSGCVKARINGEQRSPLPAVCGAGDDSERWVGV